MAEHPYDRYRESLKRAGVSDEDIDKAIQEDLDENACLAVCICPKCHGRMTKTLDPRQAGVSEVSGKWFNYRCSSPSCRYFVDRKEPVGEN